MLQIRNWNCILIFIVLLLVSCLILIMLFGQESTFKTLPRLQNGTKENATESQNAFKFPIHLLSDAKLFSSGYLHSKGRSDVSIVLGIPTMRREKQSYLRNTLHNLIENMNEEEQNETLIIVYIGETDLDNVMLINEQIERSFEPYLESGLVEVIAPALDYYPSEQLSWGSKQNLDLAYLMAYAHTKGRFYVQLEDDILTTPQFISTMKRFALIKMAFNNPIEPKWLIIDFCQYGMVGKLFKSAELPYLITYLQMFYNDMGIYKIIKHFIETTMCYRNGKHCYLEQYWIHYNSSLFQHIGNFSLKERLIRLIGKS